MTCQPSAKLVKTSSLLHLAKITKVKKFDALTVAWFVTPRASPNQLLLVFPTFSKSDEVGSEVVG